MSALIGFHRIAALRGDGLHPTLLNLLEQRAALSNDPKLANLDAVRGDGLIQAGPNPQPRENGFTPGNVIDFKPAEAVPAAGRKTSSL